MTLDEARSRIGDGATADTDQFPLTCSWCSNSPATHLAVADWRFRDGPQRLQHMLCGTCAHQTTVLPAEVEGWWLFALVPDDPFDCTAALLAVIDEVAPKAGGRS